MIEALLSKKKNSAPWKKYDAAIQNTPRVTEPCRVAGSRNLFVPEKV